MIYYQIFIDLLLLVWLLNLNSWSEPSPLLRPPGPDRILLAPFPSLQGFLLGKEVTATIWSSWGDLFKQSFKVWGDVMGQYLATNEDPAG